MRVIMKTIVLLFIAYLLGSIPSGVWIGKIFYKKDIRQYGSGNTGTTNTFRVLGTTAGSVVFVCDILKGMIATLLPFFFHLTISPLWFGIVAILGHTFPIFAHFKGGKAVATSAGMLLGYYPPFFFFSFFIFLLLLYLTSMVSLTSMLSAIIVTLSTVILPICLPFLLPKQDWFLTFVALCVSIFIIYRHKENIKRIKKGTENKVSFGLHKKEKEL